MRRWLWVCGFLYASYGLAAPPPDANPELHGWFDRQYSVKGTYCCDVSDGHILDEEDWRSVGTGYEVRINGKWLAIPPDAIRDSKRGGANPTGHAIVWYRIDVTGTVTIFCFAEGFEG